jgi:hypothetical protein
MILVDANLLIYAHVTSFPEHKAAHRWLDEALNGRAQVGMPWPSRAIAPGGRFGSDSPPISTSRRRKRWCARLPTSPASS